MCVEKELWNRIYFFFIFFYFGSSTLGSIGMDSCATISKEFKSTIDRTGFRDRLILNRLASAQVVVPAHLLTKEANARLTVDTLQFPRVKIGASELIRHADLEIVVALLPHLDIVYRTTKKQTTWYVDRQSFFRCNLLTWKVSPTKYSMLFYRSQNKAHQLSPRRAIVNPLPVICRPVVVPHLPPPTPTFPHAPPNARQHYKDFVEVKKMKKQNL